MTDLPKDLEESFNRRQLIVVVNEDGELEIEGDDFAAFEMVGIGAFVKRFGEDNLVLKEEEEP